MAFTSILRRGIGSRVIPPGPSEPPQFFFGVAGDSVIGSITESGTPGGPFSADFSLAFGSGGSNNSSINVIKLLTSVNGNGLINNIVHAIGAIAATPGIGKAGYFIVHAGANLAYPLGLASVSAAGMVASLTQAPVTNSNLSGVAASAALGVDIAHEIILLHPATAATGAIGSLNAPQSVKITTTATTTWTVPGGVSVLRLIECWGAGGSAGNAWGVPSGGGGGAYASIANLAVTPGQVITIQIGAGGIGSTSSVNVSAPGTATWFRDTSTVLAAGGAGGSNSTSVLGGQASSSVGTVAFNGGGGAHISGFSGNTAGGGGGCAGPDGNGITPGANATNAQVGDGGSGDNTQGGVGGLGVFSSTASVSGNPGIAHVKGGGGGGGAEATGAGFNGTGGPGGAPGGGGGAGNGTSVIAGGNGANGQIQITY